ncbi:urea ABC transporter permease subunit UrtB [Prosthecodimorpha staleyi]|uniref:Urea ABC transporter permease subunit UrtB n=1 Tax=Prosthecodimorpha staleyi TaxID=2840188 RepID=A0A947D3C5_9HYPH|nr:urea ABC transporter permease subunit UrtB [Prosthecodimorpha staleyi]MBT9290250.1 urea ABC transporter permease subunit UrtB [Prosthecodimorpha staleyi]
MLHSARRLAARAFAPLLLTFGLVLAVLAWLPSAAMAQASIDAALEKLTTDSYSDTIDAVQAIAVSGHPRAAVIIQALQGGQLAFSAAEKKVYVRVGNDLQEAGSGTAPATAPADLADVRANNRVRGIVSAAMGSLTLLNPDPARRLEAAASVLKSRDAAALPALDQALARETDPAVKAAFAAARAAIVLNKTDASDNERVAAIDLIRKRGGQDALGLLRGLPADTPKRVKDAAEAGAKVVETQLALWSGAQNVWYGLSLGSVLLLAAIGLAITFGVMGIINMAHGEMVMIGAYTTFVVQEVIRAHAPGLFDWSLTIAIPLAFLTSGLVGVILERTVIRWLYGRPLETLLATWGISLILMQAVRTQFGANNREVGAPSFMSGSFDIGHMSITWGRLWIIVFALAVFAALILVLKRTPLGLQMRAVTQNRSMASAMGIRTPFVDALTFGLGCGIAGIAGVALSQIDNVSPNLGQSYIIDSFMVVVFGGVGNLWGTLVGAMTLGVINKFLEPYAGAVLGKILVLVFIILFIQKRPRGLFALKGRSVEA